jgi:hypothetical protein
LGHKRRKDVYPELWINSRTYRKHSFDTGRVCQDLSQVVFVCKVNQNGICYFYARSVYVGSDQRGKTISLHYDAQNNHFNIKDEMGNSIATLTTDNFNQQHIISLTVCSYKFVKTLKHYVARQLVKRYCIKRPFIFFLIIKC